MLNRALKCGLLLAVLPNLAHRVNAGTLSGLPACKRCYFGTGGPCQQFDDQCWSLDQDTNACPAGTDLCQCPPCNNATSGPCHARNGDCLPYADPANSRCPTNAFECYTDTPSVSALDNCPACYPGTNGPCQHAASTVCFPYYPGSMLCPAGTIECSSHVAVSNVTAGMCTGCVGGSSGPCQQSNGVCWSFFEGTALCPTGTSVCAEADTVIDSANMTANGRGVGVSDGLGGNYSVAVDSVLADANSTVTPPEAAMFTKSNPCAGVSVSESVGSSACLSVVVAVPAVNHNNSSPIGSNVSLQLPPKLNAVLPFSVTVSLEGLSMSSSAQDAVKCSVTGYTKRSGTVIGNNCAPGLYTVLLTRRTGSHSEFGLTAMGITIAVGAVAVVGVIGLLVYGSFFHKRQRATILPSSVIKRADNNGVIHVCDNKSDSGSQPVSQHGNSQPNSRAALLHGSAATHSGSDSGCSNTGSGTHSDDVIYLRQTHTDEIRAAEAV